MNKKALIILSAAHLVTDINQGTLPALLPLFKEALNLNYAMAGTILFFSNIASSVIQPIFGYLSDRRPYRWLLPLAPFVSCLGMAVTGFVHSYSLLLFFVILSGLGIAGFHPEGYRTAFPFTGNRQATGMSIFSVGGNLGMALGPIFALALVDVLGLKGSLGILMPGILIAGLLMYHLSWLSPAVKPGAPPRQVQGRGSSSRQAMISLWLLVGIVILRTWIQMGLVAYIPFYYINYLKGDPIDAGILTSTFLMTGAIGTIVLSPLADRLGHRRFLAFSMLSMIPLLLLFYAANGWIVFVILAVAGFALISTYPTTVVMSQTLLPERLGMASGLTVGFSVGTGGLGVTLLGVVADAWGVPAALKSILLLPLVGFILSLLIVYPPKKAELDRERDHP